MRSIKASTISTDETSRARSIATSLRAGAKKRSSENAMVSSTSPDSGNSTASALLHVESSHELKRERLRGLGILLQRFAELLAVEAGEHLFARDCDWALD